MYREYAEIKNIINNYLKNEQQDKVKVKDHKCWKLVAGPP
jgi:hypothetical protein